MNRPHNPDDVFLADVLDGLRARPRSIPCKYFYDERGSKLFDRICRLDAYYPTRTEIGIMKEAGAEIARRIGPEAAIIEYGSGEGLKTRLLLDLVEAPVSYTPVEISEAALVDSVASLREGFPDVTIAPVCADYTREFDLELEEGARRVVFFPGSTIGNFTPEEARGFLEGVRAQVGRGGALLIGVDLVKAPSILHRAYNDSEGITAAFNKNLLVRMNRELAANFDVDAFDHYAPYNAARRRIEAYLVSLRRQEVEIAGETFDFEKGEAIHTENSYKYTVEGFAELARSAGFRPVDVWTDSDELFSVHYCEADPERLAQRT